MADQRLAFDLTSFAMADSEVLTLPCPRLCPHAGLCPQAGVCPWAGLCPCPWGHGPSSGLCPQAGVCPWAGLCPCPWGHGPSSGLCPQAGVCPWAGLCPSPWGHGPSSCPGPPAEGPGGEGGPSGCPSHHDDPGPEPCASKCFSHCSTRPQLHTCQYFAAPTESKGGGCTSPHMPFCKNGNPAGPDQSKVPHKCLCCQWPAFHPR